jgi:hypothetical protein
MSASGAGVVCIVCGYQNEPGVGFCGQCGEVVQPGQQPPRPTKVHDAPTQRLPLSAIDEVSGHGADLDARDAQDVARSGATTTVCPRCDAACDATSSKCPYCGGALAGDVPIEAHLEFSWGSEPVCDGVVVGRKPGSADDDLCPFARPYLLERSDVSRRHARVWVDGQRVLVRDLGSMNGTRIDGVSIPKDGDEVLPPTELRDGQVVEFGTAEVRATVRVRGPR